MKKLSIFLMTLAVLAGCKNQEASPSLSGTFEGTASIKSAQNGFGLSTYSSTEITLKQVGSRSVEVSGRQFDPFVIDNLTQIGATFTGGTDPNTFTYSGESTSRSLLLDWTVITPEGKPQTIRFGGSKKK